jgi:hypothetical protein
MVANESHYMNDIGKLADSFCGSVSGFVQRSIKGLTERVGGVEKRIDSLAQSFEISAKLHAGQIEKLDETVNHRAQKAVEAFIKEHQESLRGEKGDCGEPGPQGLSIEGKQGLIGPSGMDGRDGRDGSEGIAGMNGKDAAQIEPLHKIDESHSYQRGTWAHYRGGVIRAERTTDAIVDGDIKSAGWSVMVNGFTGFSIDVESDDRTFVARAFDTAGNEYVTKRWLPLPKQRGVWKQGEYEHGDYVTMAGAQWHSNRTNTDRPGTSDAWTLVVKRGSDGKDGKDRE